ncbi:hypothetical protein, partial [Gracilimonas sp.]|uniref:hypothetical protein n=1 Tax=Gracilimonas sp. TaxID=1974203 RepID=UPI00287117A3|nr:hypothetical protein [Gracilimonas sp.]
EQIPWQSVESWVCNCYRFVVGVPKLYQGDCFVVRISKPDFTLWAPRNDWGFYGLGSGIKKLTTTSSLRRLT